MERIIVLILATSSLLLACDDSKRLPNRSGDIACTEDLRVCPNGDYVARNPNNNCEFDACSTGGVSGSCGANDGCAPRINLPPN